MPMELQTLKGWIEKRGYQVSAGSPAMLRVGWHADFATKAPLPPLFVQLSDNWVLLSVLPVEVSPAYALVGLARALLAFNRKIPVAKFAMGENDEVVLCAELPTESLDEDELTGAIDTLLQCLHSYGDYGQRLPVQAV
jgi:hypothetical protein